MEKRMLWFVLLGMTEKKRAVPKEEHEQCATIPSREQLFHLSKTYYERYGLWSKIFWLTSSQKERVVKHSHNELSYHLRYTYTPIPNNSRGRTDTGSDQRIFSFECDKGWKVRSMGPHMSASFPK